MAHSIKKFSLGLVLAIGLSTPAFAQQGQRPDNHPQNSQHQYYPTSPGQTTAQQNYPSQGQGTQFGENGYQGYGYGYEGQRGQNSRGGQYGQSGQYRTYPTQGQGQQGQGYQGQGHQGQGYNGQGHQGRGKDKNKDKGRWSQPYGGGNYSPSGQGQRGYDTPCPPGLMDKGCMPPGQAKKYQIGQRLPSTMTRMMDYGRYGLYPPASGYYYSRDNHDVVMVEEATHNVIGLVRVLEQVF